MIAKLRKTLRVASSILHEVRSRPAPDVPDEFLAVGETALEYTKVVSEFGTRPPGSSSHRQLQSYLASQLTEFGCDWQRQPFTAETPIGPIELCNYIARLGRASAPTTILSGHYDTIRPEVVVPTGNTAKLARRLRALTGKSAGAASQFMGANDGGSSTGLLLAMTKLLASRDLPGSVWMVWFDGEEAFVDWSDEDQTYGSRYQATMWQEDGSLKDVQAMINVDMIGAENLHLTWELYSTPQLREQVWSIAHRCGYASRFPKRPGRHIGDDHVPFADAGVPSVDLIDDEYGPGNGYWHTLEDSIDKLNAHSFGMIAHVLWESIRELNAMDASPHR